MHRERHVLLASRGVADTHPSPVAIRRAVNALGSASAIFSNSGNANAFDVLQFICTRDERERVNDFLQLEASQRVSFLRSGIALLPKNCASEMGADKDVFARLRKSKCRLFRGAKEWRDEIQLGHIEITTLPAESPIVSLSPAGSRRKC